MNNELNSTASEVLKWMLDKEDIQLSVLGGAFESRPYTNLLYFMALDTDIHTYRIKPKELHGVPCFVTGVTILSSTSNLTAYKVQVDMLLDKAQQARLENMRVGLPVVIVTKDFFNEAVANKGSK